MPLKLSDLDIKAKLPAVPPSLPVFGLAAPSLDDRRPAMARLGEQLKLGTLRPVPFEHGMVMASERGEITFFDASGAVFARDATAHQGAVDEFRTWDGQIETTIDDQRTALNPDASKRLIAQARQMLQ